MKKRKKITVAVLVIATISMLSSCASSYSHGQIRKGIYTKERKKPDCIQAWGPVSPYNQRGNQHLIKNSKQLKMTISFKISLSKDRMI